eukprot:CAMPEP_0119106826 /NCGR_PEP_ID=MMETSP1180-20130426/6340_1 /TAXON_ID=3052 ORGANISM="Chlamydomonas cf sp, Strain CCMP681" /NCGR_SAMPLE_ID=MMETSP1180 /ASSEMBLY_ACC=CAM_ASM_000741 /LENGTH=130 /DNA_ID=CAMNT_0007092219 /DNA_START=627 /DNA_END=1020 /DNA_ORIENTATION=+
MAKNSARAFGIKVTALSVALPLQAASSTTAPPHYNTCTQTQHHPRNTALILSITAGLSGQVAGAQSGSGCKCTANLSSCAHEGDVAIIAVGWYVLVLDDDYGHDCGFLRDLTAVDHIMLPHVQDCTLSSM